MRSFRRKVIRFIRKFWHVMYTHLYTFFKELYQHAEATVILLLASLGLNALLSELPFHILLPLWVEGAMVIPLVSVMIILVLVRIAEWRARRRIPLIYAVV